MTTLLNRWQTISIMMGEPGEDPLDEFCLLQSYQVGAGTVFNQYMRAINAMHEIRREREETDLEISTFTHGIYDLHAYIDTMVEELDKTDNAEDFKILKHVNHPTCAAFKLLKSPEDTSTDEEYYSHPSVIMNFGAFLAGMSASINVLMPLKRLRANETTPRECVVECGRQLDVLKEYLQREAHRVLPAEEARAPRGYAI